MVELESLLAIGSNDVRFIGVWAMGGMGKTTLARVVYHMVSKEFEAYSFIEDVRENSEKHGLVGLQQKLISNILEETDLKIRDKYDGVLKIRNRLCHKRILLVLDDVNESDQLENLAGEHDWFGPGSRIIITTRDVHVLKTHGVDEIYAVKGLYDKDALQLFCSKAFRKEHVPNDYLVMSKEVLKYAAGLPLALKVLGSFLFGKSTNLWRSALERIKENPKKEVFNVLQISFDGLDDLDKEIFLHIACFFNHEEKDHIVEVLDSLGLHPDIGLQELIDKSLLEDDEGILRMHDLLEEMGKNIVRRECPNDCGKWNRLWRNEDIENVLKKNKGNEVVQAMHIWNYYDCYHLEDEDEETWWSPEGNSQMHDLKILRIDGISQMHNLKFLRIDGSFCAPQRLPNSLSVLSWRYYISNSLPSTFLPDGLVQLCLPDSRIKKLWIGVKNFDKLKIMDLSYSDLIICPDFTGVPNLEKLTFSNCLKLHELHPTIGILKKLVLLNLKDCRKLSHLPSKFEMDSLMTLVLSSCVRLETIPENMGNMKCLQSLNLDFTAIKELPSSIGGLIGLTSLTLRGCKNLVCLPNTICCLKSLECLDLSGTAIKELPSSIECLPSLTSLDMHGCKNLVCLPNTTCGFQFHGALDLSTCSRFKNLPENPWIIERLGRLDLSETAIEEFPSSIGGLIGLTSLTLRSCKKLVCLPNTICCLKSLECLDLSGSSNFENLPENLGNVKGLKRLNLSGTAIKELPSSIECLPSLTSLDMHGCKNLVCLPNTTCGFQFQGALDLSTCSRFKNLAENPWIIERLGRLDLSETAIEEFPSSIGGLIGLTSLNLRGCKNLVCLSNTICYLKSLECLDLSRSSNFENLPENLGNVKGLKRLNLSGTAIKELPSSIECLPSLTSLVMHGCKNLVCLPNTTCGFQFHGALDLSTCSRFKNLPENPWIIECLGRLDLSETAIEELPSSIGGLIGLTSLTLGSCKNLVYLPNTICCLKSLECLDLSRSSNFENLPENLGNVKSLKMLHLDFTAIMELPSSIGGLIGLTSLTLRGCKKLVCLPNSICCLKSLECLDLFGSSNFENLPENLGNVKGLKRLNLSGTAIKELPSSIECLPSLTSLVMHGCKNLVCFPNTTCGFQFHGALDLSTCSRFENLPENPWIIERLGMLDLSKTAIEEMPSSIGCLTNLTALTLRFCLNLVRLPSTICSLKLLNSLDLYGCIKFNNLPVNIGNMKGLKWLDLCWTDIKEVPSSIALLKSLEHLYISKWKLSEFYFMPVTLATMAPLWSSLPRSPLLSLSLHHSLSTSPVPMGFLFPSLSGLQSLTNLGLSDCNLLSISNDIGCLSSLVQLDLSGNNFVFLPESMSQLSNLRRLYLEGCKSLQSLESVPSTVDYVIANNCTSLEKLPKLQFNPSRSDHSRLNFQCCNCFKLVDYFQSSNMLQGLPNIIIPGGKIPKWFSLECQGGNIGVSFRGCDDLMGIALCIVLVPNGSQVSQLTYNLFINEFKWFVQNFQLKYGNVESPHRWLLYLSSQYLGSDWGKILSHTDANGLSQLEMKLLANKEGVEKIGVHLVYKQDIVDPNQTMAQCINNNSILYEDLADSEDQPESEIFNFAMEGEDQTSKKLDFIHGGKSHCFQDIEDPNQTITELSINSRTLYENLGDLCHDLYHSAAEGSRNKRSRDEQDWAGPSGEGYSSDEPNPKTWRLYG
ncbi:disease resistance protein RPV1-like isoform X1 [Quercus robur]|uniref:disease resistance protein RPV1-like isoform X1 n=1 Tax=Quercus robur TaxID=38942 RepID=UPI002162EC70|nr:disease resistance protein RPV1-like isoform X1 [Quercus robur]XP_050245500.1 disease resistance protein RPV1-like isoform X1 [Quercus robur]XP_050245501.1 disease resistance protein RPV1-like isoform X1 [Quercus robur]XP_050245502.1 disease resistance protein RPV1-like isoform X1 [Quercus robur]XP_050245503.1 disease resistance protein RPV1-like isoform X1 [Quercus robur]XP_050245504.1 disease resistance protein RPV1-like isoform X1 [Quercus robur]XP_050245505.1 disease resistance protein